jgi:hypothetical protein
VCAVATVVTDKDEGENGAPDSDGGLLLPDGEPDGEA